MSTGQTKTKSSQKRPTIKKGLVKAVLSGDTLLIVNIDPNKSARGPKEDEITLQGIRSPLIGIYTGNTQRNDQPFSWEAREYLRKKCIGAQVAYRITHSSNRDYGEVFLKDRDIREDLVAAGWAEVRDKEDPKNKTLSDLQKKAESDGRGIWNKDTKIANRSVRNVITKFDAFELWEKLKGKHVSAIVEKVNSAHSLRVYLPESSHSLIVNLSGVVSPLYKFNNSDETQEPYAREGKFLAELHVLNRDVDIVFEAVEKKESFLGSVLYEGKNLALTLLEEGLGSYHEYSGSKTSNNAQLKKAEASAQEKKLRLWSLGKSEASPSTSSNSNKKVGKEDFMGKVVDIMGSGSIVVAEFKDMKSGTLGEQIKVSLSSVMTPKYIPRDRLKQARDEDKLNAIFGAEAREVLRKKLIGQKVHCVQDYVREDRGDKEKRADKPFYSVYTSDKKNVAVDLVTLGLARVVDHRGNESRTAEFDQLLLAENKAKKKNLGVHGGNAKNTTQYVDLTNIEDVEKDDKLSEKQRSEKNEQNITNKLNSYLPYLVKGRASVVVDRVFTSTRFRLVIEKEGLIVPFALIGLISAPLKATTEGHYDVSGGVGNHAYQFMREQIYLRDAEIVVESVRNGVYQGALYLNKKDVAMPLIEQGFVKVHHPSALKANKVINYDEYKRAEKYAQGQRSGVWVDYDEEAELAKKKEAQAKRDEAYQASRAKKQEMVSASITEILDGSNFYYQVLGTESESLNQLTPELHKLCESQEANTSFAPAVGTHVAAKFSLDSNWYRARVLAANNNGTFRVLYIDYGNVEDVAVANLRELTKEFSLEVLPAQAHRGCLAHVKVPRLSEEYGTDAAAFFKELVWGKTMAANILYKDEGINYIVLGEREAKVHVGGALLRYGLATVPRTRDRSDDVNELRKLEELAKRERKNLWQYGDVAGDDDE